jgi:hypothetical protein
MEGLGSVEKTNDVIGNGIRDLPACSIVPQTTTLPHAPFISYLVTPLPFWLEDHPILGARNSVVPF